ncbi:MAG: hypothetical protein V7676_02975 [Parasphingorhabdus sp.]|uniref:hypothetical protein n=1 Tax=Parasphingorhabdus sp. TaxID=2709688 RepID=UPI0030039460
MSFKDLAMNLVTLGGYEQLEAAKATYASHCREYQDNRNKLYSLESERENNISTLGKLVVESFKAAKASRKMLSYVGGRHLVSSSGITLPRSEFCQKNPISNVDRIIADYSSSVAIAGGAGAGAAVAAGSWSLVALVGSASTGTAISTLSGVAATNATLAWFGGGALAAGGAGMAGGTLVLGGVTLAPVIAVAAWHSRSKTKEVNQETDKIRYADLQIRQAIGSTQNTIKMIKLSLEAIRPSAETLQRKVKAAKSSLFPIWGWSLIVRIMKNALGRNFYSDDEYEILDSLELSMIEFVSCFERLQTGHSEDTNGGLN